MTIRLLTATLLLLITDGANAESAAEPTAIYTFTPPSAVKKGGVRFPRINLRKGKEGWVKATFMVNPEGKPYDITVTDSSGNGAFEKSAIKAISSWKYEPAMLDGRPIDAGVATKITFELLPSKGARPGFVKNQQLLLAAINRGEQPVADELLAELRSADRNMYEEAFLHLTEYNYNLKWGDHHQQYAAIRQASYKDGKRFLPDSAYVASLVNRFFLETRLSLLMNALDTSEELLKEAIDDNLRTSVEAAVQKIHEFIAADRPFAIAGDIDGSYRFYHRLVNRNFRVEDLRGDLAEFRLHCDRAYIGFPFEPDIAYHVEDAAGDCALTAIGDPGTTFSLIEFD